MMIMKNQIRIITLLIVLILIITSFATICQAAATLKNTDDKKTSDSQIQTDAKPTATKKAPQPKSYMEIVAPEMIDESEVFDIFVYQTSNGASEISPKPLERAIVHVSWNNDTYITNMHGRVILASPLVNKDQYFIITASKNGFYPDEEDILVLNVPSQLIINAPSSVYEGESFTVFITADNQSVADASVVFNGETSLTNSNGSVSFIAPQVVLNTSFSIVAYKYGYLNASSEIIILNIILPQLLIYHPSTVNESSVFGVLVKANNEPVAGAYVVFNGETQMTSLNGRVIFISPQVTHDTNFSIFAYKSGYLNASSCIWVWNIDIPQLIITAPSEVYEGIYFGVLVMADNESVANATVIFNGQVQYTSLNGSVSFTAPQVFNDTDFVIQASKQGYKDAFHKITVLNIQTSPMITFFMDDISDTLTVTSVGPSNVLWSDIYINGSCNTSALGIYVTAGDVIYDCHGIIILIHLPTYTLLGQFNFSLEPQLEIVAPLSVYEFQNFTVLVKAEGHPVTNASVLFNGIKKDTNPLGVVRFTAPEVNMSTVFTIRAFKEGYMDATAQITVISLKIFGSYSI